MPRRSDCALARDLTCDSPTLCRNHGCREKHRRRLTRDSGQDIVDQWVDSALRRQEMLDKWADSALRRQENLHALAVAEGREPARVDPQKLISAGVCPAHITIAGEVIYCEIDPAKCGPHGDLKHMGLSLTTRKWKHWEDA